MVAGSRRWQAVAGGCRWPWWWLVGWLVGWLLLLLLLLLLVCLVVAVSHLVDGWWRRRWLVKVDGEGGGGVLCGCALLVFRRLGIGGGGGWRAAASQCTTHKNDVLPAMTSLTCVIMLSATRQQPTVFLPPCPLLPHRHLHRYLQ